MTEYIQVTTAVNDKDDADNIASAIISQRLAACVQLIGPIASTYWWNNDLQETEEWMCVIKTRADLYPELEALIREVHPYDVPEILAVPIVGGLRTYLDWISGETKSPAVKHDGAPPATPAAAPAAPAEPPQSTSGVSTSNTSQANS
jgi:periplasmic divalent cation tolerance protein